ncbi:hypothetical protein D9757_014255 [Collybiopsis confluens]|uniref:FAD-binding domain-containing protein n=1 Tax=Collybiopsis confluens TaxID=2823264 RepID=A0A8H5CHE5_9AGAR|nr:hypothetical protein D9757_014255 [Collybiopsis confluens]
MVEKQLLNLNILVIGGGIAGLATAYSLAAAGHTVTILEAAASPKEVGADVTRILFRWGLASKLEEIAHNDRMLNTYLCRYKNGEILASYAGGDEAAQRYGGPSYLLHRADLHGVLYDLATPHIIYRGSSRITTINPHEPSAVLDSGESVVADLIIGADGIRSIVRDAFVGGSQQARYTGDSAYRFVLPGDDVNKVPELRSLLERPTVSVWVGPQKHFVAYGIRNQQNLNVAAFVEDADQSAEYSWTSESDTDGMRAQFKGWDPRRSPTTLKYKIMDSQPLKTWVHPSGRVTLVGDACHPMTPYRAQGAAMAIEDAECLGKLFSHITRLEQIPFLLKAYENIRFERATTIQRLSAESGPYYHLPDGPAQQERDDRMRSEMEVRDALAKGEIVPPEVVATVENGRKTRQIEDDAQYKYDMTQVTEKWWAENESAM